MSYLTSLANDGVFVSSVVVISGLLIGQIQYRGIKLGTSGTLFTGLLMGMAGFTVPESYFSWNLVIFVVSVGLLSSEDALEVFKRYGLRFIFLGVVATFVGALVTFLLVKALGGSSMDPLLLAGAYTGALTSSPGLGAALEATGSSPLVTIGYTVTYPFGVVAVVIFIQIAAALFRIDLKEEKARLEGVLSDYKKPPEDESRGSSKSFSLVSLALCITGGIMVGRIGVPLPFIGNFSLGTTGGALVVSLVFGALGRVGPLNMRMDKGILAALRSFSLAYFFATVGLQAGPQVAETFAEYGILLISIGFFAALISELVAFLVGRYLLHLNWILLAGAICGAMTSTPGLGAAIDATGSEDCGAGYGATYPFALLCMVLFTKLLVSTFR